MPAQGAHALADTEESELGGEAARRGSSSEIETHTLIANGDPQPTIALREAEGGPPRSGMFRRIMSNSLTDWKSRTT